VGSFSNEQNTMGPMDASTNAMAVCSQLSSTKSEHLLTVNQERTVYSPALVIISYQSSP